MRTNAVAWTGGEAWLTHALRSISHRARSSRSLAAIAIVWLWLNLWQLLMLIVVAVVFAISLDSIVDDLCRRKIPRSLAAPVIVVVFAAVVVTFFLFAGSSLAGQAQVLGAQLREAGRAILDHTPAAVQAVVDRHGVPAPDASLLASYVVSAGRLLTAAVVVGALALVLTIYLLIEGRSAYQWLIVYVPQKHREQAHVTAREARDRIRGTSQATWPRRHLRWRSSSWR